MKFKDTTGKKIIIKKKDTTETRFGRTVPPRRAFEKKVSEKLQSIQVA